MKMSSRIEDKSGQRFSQYGKANCVRSATALKYDMRIRDIIGEERLNKASKSPSLVKPIAEHCPPADLHKPVLESP